MFPQAVLGSDPCPLESPVVFLVHLPIHCPRGHLCRPAGPQHHPHTLTPQLGTDVWMRLEGGEGYVGDCSKGSQVTLGGVRERRAHTGGVLGSAVQRGLEGCGSVNGKAEPPD